MRSRFCLRLGAQKLELKALTKYLWIERPPRKITKLRYTYTRLNVENYAACKLFYQDVLGFEVSYANDDRKYAELETEETKITCCLIIQ
jgi:hypothetical protein